MVMNHRLLLMFIMHIFMAEFIWSDWGGLDLPLEHVPYIFHNQPEVRKKCLEDYSCPYKNVTDECWGYEDDCIDTHKLSECPEDSQHWAPNKAAQRHEFWNSADFGYVQQRRVELKPYCTPFSSGDSSLICADFLRFCQATDIFIDLSKASLSASNNPYREDVIGPGQIGGHCHLDQARLSSQLGHKSPLQSWAAEMQHYTTLPFHPVTDKKCDVVITRPTYIIKLDATVNMYHHFCDYVNLYISQHVNNSFSTDVNILIWDTSGHLANSMFAETWKAFTLHPLLRLKDFDGKKVCVRQAVFSLLARMRHGLYYNMPLIPGCHGSTMMRAFSHHLMHRLQIPQHGPLEYKIRVTLLYRSTKYRRILNQDELVRALKTDVEFEVHTVDFVRSMPFLDQMEASHNSDILIGMHGAGLTHMLFQPDWAVIFELYNCEDPGCYSDLARLRGIKYMTWEDKKKLMQEDEGHHPTLGAHAKFTNYAFDVAEFMHLVRIAAKHVRNHPAFLAAHHHHFSTTPANQFLPQGRAKGIGPQSDEHVVSSREDL